MKSVRIRQADEALMMADRAAGLAENRRSVKQYHLQQERAAAGVVGQWRRAKEGRGMNSEDGENVVVDLGDRYVEHHHHAPPSQGSVAKSLVSRVLPWALAAAAGPVGALIGSYLQQGTGVNVKDVQSQFKVEVYDEQGRLIETIPYGKK